jgi:F0F1-type ATP synthase assembly protein I
VTRDQRPVRFRPGWSWTVSSTWVITSLTAMVTLLVSVVLGALVPLVTDDWGQAQTRDQAWVLAVLTVLGVVAGVIAVFLIRKRRQVLTGHGTAYVL